jgi:hypothetical protein
MLLDGVTDVAIIRPQHNNTGNNKMTNALNIIRELRHDKGMEYASLELENWNDKLQAAKEYNKLSRAIELILEIPVDTEYDLPETLEALQQWYIDTGLESFFNAEATINNIPIAA